MAKNTSHCIPAPLENVVIIGNIVDDNVTDDDLKIAKKTNGAILSSLTYTTVAPRFEPLRKDL